jgi:hypothetical protein
MLKLALTFLGAPVSRTNSQKQSVPIFAQGFEADQPFGRLDRLIAVAESIGLFGELLEYACRNGLEAAALRHHPTGKRLHIECIAGKELAAIELEGAIELREFARLRQRDEFERVDCQELPAQGDGISSQD